MRVERKAAEFRPVTITLELPEEVSMLLVALYDASAHAKRQGAVTAYEMYNALERGLKAAQ